MQKIITYILSFILLFNIFAFSTNAKVLESSISFLSFWDEAKDAYDNLPEEEKEKYRVESDCNSVLGTRNPDDGTTTVIELLDQVFLVIKFLTPAMVLVFSIIDFMKSITTQDKEILQKAVKRTVIRIVVGIIIFVVPSLLNFIFELLHWTGTCGIS